MYVYYFKYFILLISFGLSPIRKQLQSGPNAQTNWLPATYEIQLRLRCWSIQSTTNTW